MAEQQAKHRLMMESLTIQRNLQDQRLGIVFAFVIAMSSLGVGALCVYWGHAIIGALIGASGIGGIVTAFIHGTHSSRAERENKMASQ